ncbi:hypothetical protein [Paenibacillus sp. A3]|uniref:hypothetical protein n=1 Tax=Paenibacillus sp. A3 TaxID=1337054 RepID=UPI001ED9B5FD|nr:hypothetical protein [Paenibacillus sp. A3]
MPVQQLRNSGVKHILGGNFHLPLDCTLRQMRRIDPVVFGSVAVGLQVDAVRRRDIRVFEHVARPENANRLLVAVFYTRYIRLRGGFKAEGNVLALAVEKSFFAVKYHLDTRFGEIGRSNGVARSFLQRHGGSRQNHFRKISRFVQHHPIAIQNDGAAIHRVRVGGVTLHRNLDVARFQGEGLSTVNGVTLL